MTTAHLMTVLSPAALPWESWPGRPTANMISMTEFTEPVAVNCPDCESARVVKIGTRNGYQRYLCRACSKKFHTNGKAKGRRFPADQMGAAIRMFYSGMSYQQIAENMGRRTTSPNPRRPRFTSGSGTTRKTP